MLNENSYIGRDNSTDLLLEADNVAIDATVLTRAVVNLKSDTGSLDVDSDVEATLFDFTTGGGVVKIKLGLAIGVAVDEYQAKLTIYDASNTQGIVWGDPFNLSMQAAP